MNKSNIQKKGNEKMWKKWVGNKKKPPQASFAQPQLL